MNKNILLGVLAAVVIVGGLYWTRVTVPTDVTAVSQSPVVTSGENPLPGSTVHDLPVEPAAAAARKDLATKLAVEEKSIVILQITDATWNDGCLGLGGASESCLQALVSGFRVEMIAKGETYIYRTDKAGSSVRLESKK